jgi:hypothetical protein
MLVEDTTAFIEQLEVADAGRRAAKRRRRVAQSRLEILEVEWEVRVVTHALETMERSLAEIGVTTGSIGRGLLRDRRARALEREIAVTRKRLEAKRAELDARRQRLRGLEQRADECRVAKLFRLHSSQHHHECSERRFARLARSQGELPILVARKDGRRWWWFRDRFWWDDQGLAAENVRTIVLEADLDRKQRAEALARARAAILGEHLMAAPLPSEAQVVRFAVWCRDKGRCVDCRTSERVAFDRILPFDEGGSETASNIELRCEPCKERRVANEARTRVSRAQVAAAAYHR